MDRFSKNLLSICDFEMFHRVVKLSTFQCMMLNKGCYHGYDYAGVSDTLVCGGTTNNMVQGFWWPQTSSTTLVTMTTERKK